MAGGEALFLEIQRLILFLIILSFASGTLQNIWHMLQFRMLLLQNKISLEGFIHTFHTMRNVVAFKNTTDLLKSTLTFLLSLCYESLLGFAFSVFFKFS